MSKLALRMLAGWFNDGKRLTALVLVALGMLMPKLRAAGVPLPEGAEAEAAPILAAWLLVLLSKIDVRVAPKNPAPTP